MPSPHTLVAFFRAMQAAAKHKWGSDDLAGKTVAIQGCDTWMFPGAELARVGAKLIVTDVDATKVKHVADDHMPWPLSRKKLLSRCRYICAVRAGTAC